MKYLKTFEQITIFEAPLKKSKVPIIATIENNDIKKLKEMISSGLDLNEIDDAGRTAVMIAVIHRKYKFLEELINAGADLNLRDIINLETALMFSISMNDIISTKMLIDAGADPNIQDQHGKTALYYADPYKELDAFKYLLSYNKTNINIKKRNDYNALMYYIISTSNQILEPILINSGIDLNSQNYKGDTALMLAVSNKREKVIDELIKAGADLNILDYRGYSALESIPIDKLNRYDDIAKKLINAGADLRNYYNRTNMTSIKKWIEENYPEKVAAIKYNI
jgi:uncharacterized protein